MQYQEALHYILSFTDYERTPGYSANFDLRRMEELLARLNHPHLAMKSVHIAGTKGKGSTAAMIASILSAAGYRTGLYTSPHFHTLRERIRVDGRLIEEEEVALLTEEMKPHIEGVNRRAVYGQLTTFEVLTALAFCHFREKKADFQVLEAGLGGRLDATNVVKSEVCIITSISFDHTEILGNTLSQIAGEKAGIIKPGSVVVTSPQAPEAAKILERVCQEKGAKLVKVGEDITWQKRSHSLSGQRLRVRSTSNDYEFAIPLLGEHQLENAAAAVAAIEVLVSLGVRIHPGDMVTGLEQVVWPGRLQVLRLEPLFVVDGAHNADSARRLKEALQRYFQFDQLIFIIGTSVDKDGAAIAAELSSLPGIFIITRSSHPRAMSPDRLAREFASRGATYQTVDGVSKAVELALAKARAKDLICATGSLFIVAEVIEYLQGIRPEEYPAAKAQKN